MKLVGRDERGNPIWKPDDYEEQTEPKAEKSEPKTEPKEIKAKRVYKSKK